MTKIFVDEITTWPLSTIKMEVAKYGVQWCHLATDGDVSELHKFAEKIGLQRGWFQNHRRMSHYDLVPSMRQKAIEAGAISINTMEMFKICAKPKVRK